MALTGAAPEAVDAEVCKSGKYAGLVLDVRVIRNAEAFIAEVRKQYRLSINNSYRPYDEQEALYRAWIDRGKTGNPVAKPGTSRHQSGFAFDMNGLQPLRFNQWNNILNAGNRYGFHYFGDGDFDKPMDWPHFEADPIDSGTTAAEALRRNRVKRQDVALCTWKAQPSEEEQAYINRVTVAAARFTTGSVTASSGPAGVTLSYAGADLTNQGDRIVRELEVRVEVSDSLGGILLVRLADAVTIHDAPLRPGETRAVRVLLGRVYDFWQDRPPVVKIAYVGL